MENKNNILFSVAFLVTGFFVGWLIYGYEDKTNMATIPMGMHQMSDGSMMQNSNAGMQNMMEGMMMGLQGKTGDAFDQAFLSEMIMHHQGAVIMAEAVLETSRRPELTKLANDIIIAQTKEIEMMQEWQEVWFKDQ